jgi:hypothetical protein
MLIKKFPKIIPARSRVRLIRADSRTPSWKKDVGRQFRVGYYSRKDGLDCIWLVNENGKYEHTTNREYLLKYFDVEHLSRETNHYGQGKRRLGKIRIPTPLERLNGRSSIEAYEGAKRNLGKGRPKHPALGIKRIAPRQESAEQNRSGLRAESHARKIRDSHVREVCW